MKKNVAGNIHRMGAIKYRGYSYWKVTNPEI